MASLNGFSALSLVLSNQPFDPENKKPLHLWDAVAFEINYLEPYALAPRPGLEPGTYGLTVEVTLVCEGRKLKIRNSFRLVDAHVFSIPNR